MLAENDAQARQYLLAIAAGEGTSLPAHSKACELLTYIADEKTRQEMLDHLKANGPDERWSGYFSFFRDIGDVEFLDWLEHMMSAVASPLPQPLMERYAAHIRIQRDDETLVQALQSAENSLDGGWLVLQAKRHGISSERIRAAVLKRVRSQPGKAGQLAILRQCDEVGLFLPEDVAAVPEIRAAGERRQSCGDWAWPVWVKQGVAAKRAEFYRLKSNDKAQTPEPVDDDKGDRK